MTLSEKPVLNQQIALAAEVTQAQIREAEKMAQEFQGADANTYVMLVGLLTQAQALNLNAIRTKKALKTSHHQRPIQRVTVVLPAEGGRHDRQGRHARPAQRLSGCLALAGSGAVTSQTRPNLSLHAG